MFCELFGPLVGLEGEWLKQGAVPGELDLTDFCSDYVPVATAGAITGMMGGFEETVLSETDEYIMSRDNFGRTAKLIKNAATIPLPMDFPVTDMKSWLSLKPFFEYSEERVDALSLRRAAESQRNGVFICEWIPGGYDIPRELMGEEALSYALYDQPELIDDIIGTLTDTSVRVLEAVCKILTPDCLCVHEDMAGKSGPLFGPKHIERFVKPHYEQCWDLVKKKGTSLFSIDSDGNINAITDALAGCGINVFYPMEPAAGMDMVRLREKYGRGIYFKGGIDKHVIRQGRGQIKKELEYKLCPLMREGGCVFALDHRIPNGTPLADYRYYVDAARDILGLPEKENDEKGWSRMAF